VVIADPHGHPLATFERTYERIATIMERAAAS
jgi:hypothetical protein